MLPWLVSWLGPIALRYAVQAAGGFVIGHGWVNDAGWKQIVGGLAMIAAATSWALVKNANIKAILDRIALLPIIEKIAVTDPKVAAETVSQKIDLSNLPRPEGYSQAQV